MKLGEWIDDMPIKPMRILMSERNLWTKTVEKLLIFIDIELGYNENYLHQPTNRQVKRTYQNS